MSLDDALRVAPRLLRARAGELLPLYLLAASAPGVARTPLVAAGAVAVAVLAVSGRLDPAVATLREADVGGGPGGPGQSGSEAAVDAVAGLLTPTVVVLLVVGGLAAVAVLVLAQAVGSAATLAAVTAGLRGEAPLVAGVRGVPRHWRAFAVLTLLRVGLYAALGGVLVGLVALAGGVTAAVGAPAAGAALAVLGGIAALPVVVAVELLFAFAGCAVVVDDAGATGALRRAAGLARERPGAYVVFLAVGGAAVVGLGVLTGLAAVAGVGRAVGVLVTLLVFPLLDGLRVALYADRGAGDVEGSGVGPLAAVRNGLAALGRFLRDHPSANAGGAALLAAGAAAGWALVAPYGVALDRPTDVGDVFGTVAVGPFVNIAANNWLVAASAACGGLAAGLPTVAALGLNGVLVGAVAAATDRITFLALVGPHGVLELPAIAVAGGLGLHLGRVGLDAVRGQRNAAAVAEAVQRAFRVLVGLGVVFVVAAAVEAFVTPAVAAAVLG